MINIGAVITMVLLAALTAAVPIGGMVLLARRGGRWREFLVGAGTFFLFAMVLEQLFHALILGSGLGQALRDSIWLYGLYGGLAAGVFEETGRFLAFRLALGGRRGRIAALSCGLGHGGCEAFLLLGVTYVNNLVLLFTAAGGGTLPPELAGAAEQLAAVPVSMFLWAGLERAVAMAFHMALSVLVYAAVTRPGRRWLFPAAIALHAALDFAAVTASAYLPVALTELLVAAWALAAVWLAVQVYRKLPENGENP